MDEKPRKLRKRTNDKINSSKYMKYLKYMNISISSTYVTIEPTIGYTITERRNRAEVKILGRAQKVLYNCRRQESRYDSLHNI